MEKLDATEKNRSGLDRYEGFVIDLASDIANIVGFNFTVNIADGYGSVDKHGNWNGMIKEILDEVSEILILKINGSFFGPLQRVSCWNLVLRL